MSSPVSGNNINDQAYANIKKETVYASADNNPQDSKIDYNEANSSNGSIFTKALQSGDTTSTQIEQSRIAKYGNANATVQKYLGGKTFQSMINFVTSFGNINYQAQEVQDSENSADVRAQIDTQITSSIQSKVDSLITKMTQQYEAALKNAITQAENELIGDADITKDGSLTTKDDDYGKLQDLMYKRPEDEGNDGEHTSVSTFNSSAKGAEEKSQGYTNTVAYLEANGAKAKTKLVNGQEQTVYKVKVDGKTQYVTVDDAGQVHDLDKNKGFLRSSKFTTQDSIADAQEQLKNEGYQGGFNGKDVKVKVRNVDGQNQSVMTWEDDNGQKHSRVIDHDNQSGMTSSMDVNKVNAGGRAKYSSDVSGLGALANKDSGDDIKFENNRFQNGTWTDENGGVHADNVNTQHGRMKLDAQNTGTAIDNITASAIKAGATIGMTDENTTVITFQNGHSYTLDKTDNVGANRTMRLIQGEINRAGQGNIEITPEDSEATITVDEDLRGDTNLKFNHQGEKWSIGNGEVQDVGIDNPSSHQSSAGGKGKVNSVRYGTDLSRAQFANEGWKASAGRKDETEVLKAMDSDGVKGDGKSVRNLKTANEFAERFIKAKGLDPKNYNLSSLAKALTAANPSFFDANGDMYKNCDFNRINLPKKLDRYANE